MKRREFITLIAGAMIQRPSRPRAQQAPKPVIGFLALDPPPPNFRYAFLNGLAEAGYIEGQNIVIEYRWAEGRYNNRMRALAAELVHQNVALIFAVGSFGAVYAAKAATSTIPIVFATGGDVVKYGLVTNLSRPGGNITGVTTFGLELTAKRLELLCEMVTQAKTIAYLTGGPGFVAFEDEWGSVVAAVLKLERKVAILKAPTIDDIDAAFTTLAFPGGRGDVIGQRQADALIVGVAPHFFHAAKEILALAAYYKVPAVYPNSEWCRGGGLMSYGGSFSEQYRRAGQYVGQILNGAKPGDLPVQRSTKFELVINVRTAKALGLTIPPSLLARADEVIE